MCCIALQNTNVLLGYMDFAKMCACGMKCLFGFVKFLFDDKVVVVTKKLL